MHLAKKLLPCFPAHHLYVVSEAGEDEAGDDEDHPQQPQLRHTLAQGEHDGLQTPGVSGEWHMFTFPQ